MALSTWRALAHEFGELARLMTGHGEKSDVLTADGDLSDHELSPHDLGRLSELRLLMVRQLNPAYRAERRALMRQQMAALLQHLGLKPEQDGSVERAALLPADLRRWALDPEVSRVDRVEFVLPSELDRHRKINWLPHAYDPDWGLTREHLDKHLFGARSSALAAIDPAGDAATWLRHLQHLATQPPRKQFDNGVVEIRGRFPKSDGTGTFKLGIRLAQRPDGTFDLVTILTGQ
jgi:hypothetical protein